METGKIDVFAFIGTNKGAMILKNFIQITSAQSDLGLDAKNPAFVLPDADIDNAVSESSWVLYPLMVNDAQRLNFFLFTIPSSIHSFRSLVIR